MDPFLAFVWAVPLKLAVRSEGRREGVFYTPPLHDRGLNGTVPDFVRAAPYADYSCSQ